MTLSASAGLLNLKKSLESHLASGLAGETVSLDWEGTAGFLGREAEVIQPRLRMVNQKNMGNGPLGLGMELTFELSLNILVKPQPDSGRLAELRDLLAGLFRPGRRLPLLDFGQIPAAEIDRITFLGLAVDQGVPTSGGFLQHNLTVAGRVVQDWSD